MSWHLLIHWLDLGRHDFAAAFGWFPVSSNIGAGVWWAVIAGITSYIIWPKFRDKVNNWVKGHLESHRNTQHEHNASLFRELHEKMDHIIKHSPDIPDFPTKKETT